MPCYTTCGLPGDIFAIQMPPPLRFVAYYEQVSGGQVGAIWPQQLYAYN